VEFLERLAIGMWCIFWGWSASWHRKYYISMH